MYGELDYESFNDYSTPEIQRVPLESLVLQAADLKLGNIRKYNNNNNNNENFFVTCISCDSLFY